MKTIKIKVQTKQQNYSILIGSGIANNISKFLNHSSIKFSKCLLVFDKKIPKKFVKKIVKSLPEKKIITYFFNAQETTKNQISINKIIDLLLKKNFHRNDCLISIGGGITGDVCGFASSIFSVHNWATLNVATVFIFTKYSIFFF